MNYNHLATCLIGLHDAVSFLDLVETENSRRFDVESTGRSVPCDLAKWDVGERETWRTEHKASEECQGDSARHLQQRVEISDRIETAQPPGQTRTTAPARSIASESSKTLLPTRSSTASIFFVSGICLDRSGRSTSQRSAPKFCSLAKRSRLRVVAITRRPALTAILRAA